MDITKLISDLSAHNVAHFEGYGIKVSFHKHQVKQIPIISEPIELEKTESKKSEPLTDAALAQMPDAEMNFDQILNWSASPDQKDIPVPLSGESTLTSEG